MTPTDQPGKNVGFECAICLDCLHEPSPTTVVGEEQEYDQRAIVALRCGHLFHDACLNTWVKGLGRQRKTCPTCRKQFLKRGIMRLFPDVATNYGQRDTTCSQVNGTTEGSSPIASSVGSSACKTTQRTSVGWIYPTRQRQVGIQGWISEIVSAIFLVTGFITLVVLLRQLNLRIPDKI